MSCGLPSIVSDIGGCSDLVTQDVNGYRVDAENVDGFYEKLCLLIDDADKREKMGRAATDFCKNNCDYEKVIGDLEHVVVNARNFYGDF